MIRKAKENLPKPIAFCSSKLLNFLLIPTYFSIKSSLIVSSVLIYDFSFFNSFESLSKFVPVYEDNN